MRWELSEEAIWTPCWKGFLKDGQARGEEGCGLGTQHMGGHWTGTGLALHF